MLAPPVRYDVKSDKRVLVTQDWVDAVELEFAAFGKARAEARRAIGLGLVPAPVVLELHKFLDAWRPQFEQVSS